MQSTRWTREYLVLQVMLHSQVQRRMLKRENFLRTPLNVFTFIHLQRYRRGPPFPPSQGFTRNEQHLIQRFISAVSAVPVPGPARVKLQQSCLKVVLMQTRHFPLLLFHNKSVWSARRLLLWRSHWKRKEFVTAVSAYKTRQFGLILTADHFQILQRNFILLIN